MVRSINMPNRAARARKIALVALSSTVAMVPGVAWADCTASNSTTVTCSGTSAAYTNSASGVNVTVNSGASVTSPLVIGSSGTLTNAGTITNTGAVYGVQYGDNATITNNGTITSSSSSSGAGTISVGANSTVTNNAVMTAYAGTPLVTFGTNGTFINNTAATAALTGIVAFGTNTGTDRAYFYNYNTAYGLTGSVTASGNITAYNNGIFTGNFVQTAKALDNAVVFTNDTSGTYTGLIVTGDQTTLTNNGTMYLYSGSTIGSLGLYASQVTNNKDLWVGTTSSPAVLSIYGNYTQSSTGTLNVAIIPSGSATNAAGTTYSQIYTTGTATLAGKLNLNVSAGFYPTGTTFDVVKADGGISGTFTSDNITVNSGTNLLFVTFSGLGVITTSGTQQVYRVAATHNSYATVMQAAGANANQLAISRGLDKLLVTASANTGSDAAAFLGTVDIINNTSDAKLFLDQLSPEGYLAYATALRDQANLFARTINHRMGDQNSDHPEDGWWLTPQMQASFSSTASQVGGYRTKDNLVGLTGGYDFSGPNHVWGLAVNLSWDKLRYAAQSLSGTNRDYAIALYGGKNFGPLHVTGQLAYNAGKLTTSKIITIGGYTRTAAGSASEYLAKATAKAGFQLKFNGMVLEPFVGIDFNKGRISAFTETGAGSANLTISAISADRTEALAGVSFTRSKGMFRPYVDVTYRSRMSGAGNTVTALMNAQADTQFTVTGLAQGKNQIDANAGMNFVFDDAGALFVGYQGTYRTDYKAHGINLGIRLEF
ncbi:autotransporter domain-containing protein [Novosphingobium umbonatum]|uniref:Autotransporter domain-containing protein n=1 Tax=Novosphingobium umbonatum TaxID=1908524 RepID=A0A3S2X490_9SPHN|nr:autotransporter outer membrane beta-barrel domain-containing protein [Novosphingobium umbonatum]RVU05356.1 autotransporter domain-containing protein [Novosphingobium umbonatum]